MTILCRPSRRHPAYLKHRDHARLWRLVEGAVVDAFRSHPGFLTDEGHRSAVQSVTKRVVGQIVGHAQQAQPRGRLGDSCGQSEIPGAPKGVGRHFLSLPRIRLAAIFDVFRGGER